MKPSYTLEKVKFGTDPATFQKAVELYEKGKVIQFKEHLRGYSALVLSTHSYHVDVHTKDYDRGYCDCYLGQTDVLCKHMVAVALRAVLDGKPLSKEDKNMITEVTSSGKTGELSKKELFSVGKKITSALKYIKSYDGPSKYWFAYQNSLDEGVARLSAIVSKLPVSKQTTNLVIDLLLRLDKKVCESGVDDSNGTVGGFIIETVEMLKEYAKTDSSTNECFKRFQNIKTCFGWEEPLLKLTNKN
jgi:hypothetical protein